MGTTGTTRGVRLLGKLRPRPATPPPVAAECVREPLTGED